MLGVGNGAVMEWVEAGQRLVDSGWSKKEVTTCRLTVVGRWPAAVEWLWLGGWTWTAMPLRG